jgi:2-hydroxychromene-2-carboxylate isomerase
MKQVTFYFDPISPYAYLAFEHLPQALLGLSYQIIYKPVLFGALLKHHGQLGPAEMPGKRDWTYRQVLWQAQQHDIELQLPATHPFNPLALLRLAVACDPQGLPNRYVCETLFRHVWRGGADAADPARLSALLEQLAPERDVASEAVKNGLKAHTQEAIAAGVFGVPTLVVDDRLFWGFDALPMLADYMAHGAWSAGPDWQRAALVRMGPPRKLAR